MCLFYCRKLAAETTLDRSLPPKIRLRKTFYLTYEVRLKIAASGFCLMGCTSQYSYRVKQSSYI